MNPNFKEKQILDNFVADKEVRREMTTSNLNQLMKKKININPQLLSKNTSEIVSTCIKKLYEQIPQQYRNGLQQIKIASARMENKAPLRTLKETEKLLQQKSERLAASPRKHVASNVDEALLLRRVMASSRKRLLSNNQAAEGGKKLLKPPTYKIYNQRRFGSSASSSSSRSFFRRQEPVKRIKSGLSSHALRQLKKSFTMIHGGGGGGPVTKKSSTNMKPKIVASLVQPSKKRSTHMFKGMSTKPKPLEVQNNIHTNLMAIDDLLKNRISPEPKKPPTKPLTHTTIWDYPPMPQLSHCRNEQNVANRVLQQQCQRLQMALQQKLWKGATSSNDQPEPQPTQPTPYRETLMRQRYTYPVVIKRETIRSNSISPNQRQVYVKRKPLSELQRPQIPEIWSTNYDHSTMHRTLNIQADKENVFGVRGHAVFTSPTTTTTPQNSNAGSSFGGQYNQNNRYAKLAANVH
ncbi:uncharacterized protein [Musca autumnalis]|uniref:uncharacterized protein n=1 Tax=Musca autumnalis TaxID=221902 RepID=UPI003CF8E616